MMTNFYDSFGEDANANKQVSDEIIEELNKDIPRNLEYIQTAEGKWQIVPRQEFIGKGMRLTTNIELDLEKDERLVSVLKTLPQDKWDEYLYRTQKSVAVKNIKIGDENSLIPIEKTTGNPFFDNQAIISECRMYPQEFDPPISFIYELDDKYKIELLLQQQVYDSLNEIKFSNINHPEMKCDLYVYYPLIDEEDENSKTSVENPCYTVYSVTPTKAESVSEAVTALNIFYGILMGTTSINGKTNNSNSTNVDVDVERLQELMEFWSSLLQLEKELKVQFNPDADFPQEDSIFFEQLNQCIIKKKAVIWERPFDHFHVGGISMNSAEKTKDELVGKGPISFEFYEGPIHATLLGSEFELYSWTKLSDFTIERIEWDDETKESGELYIKDESRKTFTLNRLYMTKEKFEEIKEDLKRQKETKEV